MYYYYYYFYHYYYQVTAEKVIFVESLKGLVWALVLRGQTDPEGSGIENGVKIHLASTHSTYRVYLGKIVQFAEQIEPFIRGKIRREVFV